MVVQKWVVKKQVLHGSGELLKEKRNNQFLNFLHAVLFTGSKIFLYPCVHSVQKRKMVGCENLALGWDLLKLFRFYSSLT